MPTDKSTAADDDHPGDAREGEVPVDAVQLRPGVHVRLPVGWLDHPFLKNSFVISDPAQVQQIAALKLPRIYCDLSRCTSAPLPHPRAVAVPSAEEEQARAELAAQLERKTAEKQARAAGVGALRARLDVAQKHYNVAAQEVGAAIKGFERNPQASVQQIGAVSAQSAQVLMHNADSALALISEKGHTDAMHAHALSVMTLALLLGKQARLPQPAMNELGVAALLHDIGKLELDISLVRKPERSKFEEIIYQSHCQLGHDIAARAKGLSRQVLEAILHHHERADGSGYPAHTPGSGTPLAARIVAIANRFDNLANPVDARRALSPSEALAVMWSQEKQHFDVTLLQLFVRAMGVYPPGSLVLLSDGHAGVVVASAATESPLRPQVLIHEAGVPRRHAQIIDLAVEGAIRIERSLHVRDRSTDEVDYLLPRRKLSWLHVTSD